MEYRIFGPPGCGKTTQLSRLVTSRVQEYGSEGVIVASFTKTAARELVGRGLPLDDTQIGTLHALAYRELGRPTVCAGAVLDEWNQRHPAWAVSGGKAVDPDDPYADFDMMAQGVGDSLLQEMGRVRNLMIPRERWPMSVQMFAGAWDQFKADTDTVDFTDMIERCTTEQVGIPLGGRVLFLDEAQDFSPLELALARHWGSQCEQFYTVGDPDQCIYGFKGSTPMAFLTPELPQEQRSVLSQSYRVPRAVHAAAVSWMRPVGGRADVEYAPRDADGGVDCCPVTYKYLDPLRELLLEWTGKGQTVGLFAACSYMVDPIKHQLRAWGIPFHNPWRRRRGDWNPLHGKAGTMSAAARVLAYRQLADQDQWWTYGQLHAWGAALKADPVFAHGAKTALRQKAEAEPDRPVEADDLERWIPNPATARMVISGDLGWLRQHVLPNYQKPIDYACDVLAQHGREGLTTAPKVVVGTIHSVKGGEVDHVVLFPDLSLRGMEQWASGGEGHDAIRRMFYVGMTRAREAVHWATPCGPSIEGYL